MLNGENLKCIKIVWDFKYHKYWPRLYEHMKSVKIIHNTEIETCYTRTFNDQTTLLISKHRQHSQFEYINSFSRLVANTSIRHLASWHTVVL